MPQVTIFEPTSIPVIGPQIGNEEFYQSKITVDE
jgi:hypothetical protein